MKRRKSWLSRLTIRAKLTATFTILLALSGAAAIIAVYSYSTYVPDFRVGVVVTPMDTVEPDNADSPTVVTEEQGTESDSGANGMRALEDVKLETVDDILDQLMFVLVLSVVLIVALGGYLSWVLSGKLLRPLQRINETAQLAATGSFDHRVDVSGPRDEIQQLAETFNHMLEKIQRSFQAHERFTANASHEMRTPLSAIKTTLEVALSDPDADPTSLRAAAERVQQLNDRTTNLINSLLDLTVVDNSEIERDELQLNAVLHHALGTVAKEADEAAISIHTTGVDDVTMVCGDEMLLEQAFTNLLQNAIRHNHHGGEIWVRLRADESQATVAIENTGGAVSPDVVAQLTEPFYRGAGRAVNSDKHRGFGLGLTLVESIAVLHGGEVLIASREEGGLNIVVQLPR